MDQTAAKRPARADDATWLELEDLLDEVARLATPATPPREFYAGLLERTVRALAATAGAVFLRNSVGQLRLEYQVNFAGTRLLDGQAAQVVHGRMLEEVLRSCQPRVSAPGAGAATDEPLENPTDLLLVQAPIVVDDEAVGIVEICQAATSDAVSQRGIVKLLSAMCELAGDYQRQRQLRELRERQSLADRLERFTDRIHARLDMKATAFAIANEGRAALDCDRLSVLQVQGSHCRVVCVSGVDRVERRASEMRLLERLVAAAVAAGDPMWHTDESAGAAPQIDTHLHAYLDRAQSRLLAVLPILETESQPGARRRPKTIAAIVVEQFTSGQVEEEWRRRAETVAHRCAPALRNARAYERLPFLTLLRVIRWLLSWLVPPRLLKTVLTIAVMTGIVAALVLIPADFDLEGRGELQPKVRRDVFAPADGVVREVRVEQGDRVDPQDDTRDVLAVLQRPELELEASRVHGEMQTARKRLTAIQAQRLGARAAGNDPAKLNQLSADEEEVKEQLTGLEKQQQIIQQQQAALTVRAPITGEVVTWNLHELLDARPVQRGQTLMTVAQVDGPWVLEIRMLDERIGHVLEAREQGAKDLEVSFVRATAPGTRLSGKIVDVAATTEPDGEQRPSVLITVDIDKSQIADRRPGATVVAKVHCGRRALGYVWLHEVWEAIQRKMLF